MNILLDTHAAIWFFNGDRNLSEAAKRAILSDENTKHISIASVWEVAIKTGLGKLLFKGDVKGFVRLIENNGINILPVSVNHLYELEKLPYIHRDPFDRMIIATAVAGKMKILTTDKNIRLYTSDCIW
ncbi:PIN domain protein [Bacteroidales bacterium Barb7]|nr:PIN domain protein [Bacteroidales bacterium Barb7]